MLRFLALAAVVTVCVGHTADKSKWKSPVCTDKGVYGPAPEFEDALKACGDGECVFNCQADVLGWKNADGTVTLDIFEDYIQSFVGPDFEEFCLGRVRSCWKSFGVHIVDDGEKCHFSKSFTDCLWSSIPLMHCKPSGL